MASYIKCLRHHCLKDHEPLSGSALRTEGHLQIAELQLQMLGENVVGTVLEMGRQIRQQASQPLPAGDAEGSVFLDILGGKMVHIKLLPFNGDLVHI